MTGRSVRAEKVDLMLPADGLDLPDADQQSGQAGEEIADAHDDAYADASQIRKVLQEPQHGIRYKNTRLKLMNRVMRVLPKP